MASDFDVGAPALQVNVFEEGRLVARVPCETAQEAADVVAELEEKDGVRCEIEDLGTRHGPEDVLAPEPEDAARPEYEDI
jgi:hypothetical protein